MNDTGHIPVLSREVVEALNLGPASIVLDATFGRGGHASLCLQKLGPEGRLIALDRDPEAVAFAARTFADEPRLMVTRSRFSELDSVLNDLGLMGRVNAILLDLGVSSPQLDQAGRGFSFAAHGPIEMRMDPDSGLSALEWLIEVSEDELSRTLRTLGEERFSRRIAAAIKQALAADQLHSTTELAKVVADAMPVHERHKHPATRTFQAIRMAVNGEIEELKSALPKALEALAEGGRLAVISFHSLEDRIVKNFMRDNAKGDHLPPDLPITADRITPPRMRLVGKAIRAGREELKINPRARSAVLRVAEKLH